VNLIGFIIKETPQEFFNKLLWGEKMLSSTFGHVL